MDTMETSVFVISFGKHLVFCIVACLFFLVQFYRLRYKYQLTMAIAIPATLLLYLSDNKIWFYSIGLFELFMLILSAVLLFTGRHREEKRQEAAAAAAQAPPAGGEQP